MCLHTQRADLPGRGFGGKWPRLGARSEISRDCDELCSWLQELCSNTGNMWRCPRRRRQRDDDGRQLFEQICIHTPKSYNLPTSTRPANLSLCKKSQNCVLILSQLCFNLMIDAEKFSPGLRRPTPTATAPSDIFTTNRRQAVRAKRCIFSSVCFPRMLCV